MSVATQVLPSQNHWIADGVQVVWNFNFLGGYINRDHVKAYTKTPAGVRTELVINPEDFLGDFQIRINPAVASGDTLVIYRATPKGLPLVDFTDGAEINEISLDIVARQSVFIAAESADFLGVTTTEDLANLASQAGTAAAAATAAATTATAAAAAANASVGQIVTDLAAADSASKGAGKIGFGSAIVYAAGSVGAALRSVVATVADMGSSTGSRLIGYMHTAANATVRTVRDKFLEQWVSIADFGGVPGLATDNTAAFNRCLVALGSKGGTIYFPAGNWRGNFLVNQHGVTLRGSGGGVGELLVSDASATMLRPWLTGANTTTVMLSNQTRVNRKLGLQDIVISGDNGSGVMADQALWVNGGSVNVWIRGVDLMDGLRSYRVEGGNSFPATAIKASQFTIRNDVNLPAARAIYVRKYSDAIGYVTDFYMNQLKVNKTGAGYWMELDGTGSTGLVVHVGQAYVDHSPGLGILFSASGLETLECDGGLQLDPGAAGTVIVKRQDMVKDLSRFMRGHIEGAGGQLIQFADNSTVTMPVEPGLISYMPLFRQPFLIGPYRYTNATNPYGTDCPTEDLTAANGYMVMTQAQGRGIQSANASRWLWGQIEQELTLSTTGTVTNNPTGNLLPDNCIIEAVSYRVTQTITGAASFTIGDPVVAARFASTITTLTAGSTGFGLNHVDQTGTAGPKQSVGNNLRITTNATASAGKVRVTVFYRQFTPPTS